MITGFNTDVKYKGVVYHVQTEDKGTANPLIETLIYKGGEILGSRRLPYADLVTRGDEAAITKLMEDQHKGMIMEVKRGRFDLANERTVMEDLSLDGRPALDSLGMTEPVGIQVSVNGETLRVPSGSTVADILRQLSLDRARVAVEHNLRVVPRAEHASLRLNHGDRLEIVTFVGGG